MIYKLSFFSIFLITVTTSIQCKKKPADGYYCAKVEFQNPQNNKKTTYTIVSEVKDNKLIDLSFPEGHFDTTAVKPVEIPFDGVLSAVTAGGMIYSIKMQGGLEKCQKAVNMLQCKGKAKDGSRCKRYTNNKNGYCWQHQQQK